MTAFVIVERYVLGLGQEITKVFSVEVLKCVSCICISCSCPVDDYERKPLLVAPNKLFDPLSEAAKIELAHSFSVPWPVPARQERALP